MTQAARCVAAYRVRDVVFSPDGKSVAIRSAGALQLFDIDSGAARWTYGRGGGVDFTRDAFSADGRLLSVGGSGTDKATILDAGDGHIVMRCGISPAFEKLSTQAYISPDGTRLITLLGRKGRVYELTLGGETLRFRHNRRCHGLQYSPDGTRIATLDFDRHGSHVRDAASVQLQVWDAASFQLQVAGMRPWSRARTVDGPIVRLENVPAGTNRMQFGGCSHVLVAAARNDSVIRVWDVASGTLTMQLDTAPGTKWLRLGDGCGRVALTSCADGTLRVWDVASGQERTRLPTPQEFRTGTVNSDATKLATSDGQSVEIWSIDGPAAPADAPPDDWCPRCAAGRHDVPPPDKAYGRSWSPKRR